MTYNEDAAIRSRAETRFKGYRNTSHSLAEIEKAFAGDPLRHWCNPAGGSIPYIDVALLGYQPIFLRHTFLISPEPLADAWNLKCLELVNPSRV